MPSDVRIPLIIPLGFHREKLKFAWRFVVTRVAFQNTQFGARIFVRNTRFYIVGKYFLAKNSFDLDSVSGEIEILHLFIYTNCNVDERVPFPTTEELAWRID